MEIIKINPQSPDLKTIKKAAQLLLSGKLIIYPTETSYGIGADISNEHAVKKIFQIKNRNFSNPLLVAVKDLSMAKKLAHFSPLAKILWQHFLPGPLTLVLPKKKDVSRQITAGQKTVGLRFPDHPITHLLSTECKIPYTTTSANISGQPSAYSINEIKNQLGKKINKIALVLDAGQLPVNPPSTIIYLANHKIKILRKGAISLRKIQKIIKNHSWNQKGIYIVKAAAKDVNGLQGSYGTLTVTIPRSVSKNTLLNILLERFPNIFKLVKYILS